MSCDLVRHLRLLLAESAGTIADVAYRLEKSTYAVDEHDRALLRDDVLQLDEELASLKAWLLAPLDWDAEYARLLAGEVPGIEDTEEDPGESTDGDTHV